MRIQPSPSSPRSRLDLGKWFRTRKPSDWTRLVWALAIVLVCAVGIWYGVRRRSLLDRLMANLFHSGSEDANGLPTLHLDIPLETYQVLNEQWREAVQNGILQLDDRQWLPAQARFQGETTPIQLWLEWEQAGDGQEIRWPLQIKMQNEATILGMRSFSAQPPATGRCMDEWLYMEELRRADILAPRYAFVNVFVNGDDWGIYTLKEKFSQEWFASQKRQESVIVHLEDSLFWKRWSLPGDAVDVSHPYTYWNVFADPMNVASDLPAFAQVDEPGADAIGKDRPLSEQAITALGLLRAFQGQKLGASAVFDAERMGKYIAHTNLWGARQGTVEHNEHYYYNPSVAKLEPIGYERFASMPNSGHLVDLAQYDDPDVMRAFVQEVWRISRPEYLDELRTHYRQDIERYYAALSKELPAAELELPWDILARRQVSLNAALHPTQPVHAYQSNPALPDNAPDAMMVLQVSNLSRYPVVLQRLQIGEHGIDVRPDWVAQESANLVHPASDQIVLRCASGVIPQYVTLHIPATAIQELRAQDASSAPDTLQLVVDLVGVEEPIAVDVQRDYPAALSATVLPAQPSVQEALERYPFLAMGDRPGFLELRPGTWAVDGDLVLPAGIGLRATLPVTLTFDPGAVFLSSGPLLLRGPDGTGIHLIPRHEEWAGIAVLKTGSQVASTLVNVEIRGATGIHREGWNTEGGVAFYESAVILQHCRLLDSAAPAMIRVVHAHFEFTDSEFAGAAQNAFDSDSAEGRIAGCVFHDIIANAINAYGSEIAIQNTDLIRVYDKGILASRDSVVVIQALRAADVGIAIASRDMSYVNARDIRISQASIAGLAAYTGKEGYGPAILQASHVVFDEDESTRALVQQESSVTLNGMDAAGWNTSPAREMTTDDSDEALGVTHVLNYRLGPTIRLIGYSLSPTPWASGGAAELVLYWRALARPPLDYTIFVHLLDAEGQQVTGWDTMPRSNTFPTTQWPVRTVVGDIHQLALPADLPPGEYQIALGMYDLPTQERLPIYDPVENSVPDARIVLEHKIEVH